MKDPDDSYEGARLKYKIYKFQLSIEYLQNYYKWIKILNEVKEKFM